MLNLGLDKVTVDKIRNIANDFRNQAVVAKNETERQVYEALSNKNWGTSSTVLNDIARDTYDFEKYNMIMTIVWQSLDSPGREWRKVFKALGLLEHLIKNGTERVVEDARDHLHRIKTLAEFNYYEGHADKGSGVREKSKQIIELLKNNDHIRDEREKARKLRDKYIGISNNGGSFGGTSSRFDGLGSISDRDFGRSSSRYAFSDTYRVDDFKRSPTDRYTDDPPVEQDSTKSNDDESPKVEVKPKKTAKKKANSAKTKEKLVPATQSNLLEKNDNDFNPRASAKPLAPPPSMSGTKAVSMPATDWDPFASSPTPQTESADVFDPFGTSNQSFDPFGTASLIQPTPMPQPVTADLINPPKTSTAPPTNDLFGMMMQQPSNTDVLTPQQPSLFQPSTSNFDGPLQFMPMTSASTSAPQQNLFSLNSVPLTPQSSDAKANFNLPMTNPPINRAASSTIEFGDFQVQSNVTPTNVKSMQVSNNKVDEKWGELSSLVNLGGLKSNTEKKQEDDKSSGLADRLNTQAFAGLDGFRVPSKMNQGSFGSASMNTQPRPMQNSFNSLGIQSSPNNMGSLNQQWSGMGMMGNTNGLSNQGGMNGQMRLNAMQGGSMMSQGYMGSQPNTMPMQNNMQTGFGNQGFF